MRRYRKGQVFRVPTTAESAAQADAIEAFRRSPPRPQDKPPTGQGMIVKTPAAGIPARSGATIYSAICTRCVETSTAEQKTLLDTDEEIEVFNLETTAIAGSAYIHTDLSPSGTRYAEKSSAAGHIVIQFQIIDLAPYTDLITSGCVVVDAEVLSVSCQSAGVAVGDEVRVYDPNQCWFNVPVSVLQGEVGVAVQMAKATEYWDIPLCIEELDGDCWWMVTHLCCLEELYSG